MPDREKVQKGLECCSESISNACPMECPYRVECLMQDDELHMYSVMHDALKLLKEQQETITSLQGTIRKLNAALTEQPEQKHGHWIPIKSETGVEYGGFKQYAVYDVKCSACGFADDVSTCVYTYCPNCGAKMDEEVKQE